MTITTAPPSAEQVRAKVAQPRRRPPNNRRAFWMTQLRRWHWISSAVCLVGMLGFALTGITLNHAARIEARPQVASKEAMLPPELLVLLQAPPAQAKRPLPEPVVAWLAQNLSVATGGREAEWSEKEIYVGLPRPGGDAWLSLDRADGSVLYERTDRGWISYLNDLHKGRNTGAAWSWFIDAFAIACVVFCVTGLCLLQLYSASRPATWPTVGVGILIPLLLAIWFIH